MGEIERFDETLAAARDGDARAFEMMWRSLQPRLARYVSVAAAGSADDVASETWLQVARGIHRFRGDENDFRRWFFTIARRRVLDDARRTRRSGIQPVPPETLAGLIDRADPLEERMSTSAALELIRTLPPAQAEAVALRVIADLSVADVARVMGKCPGAVRALTSRGLGALAERLSAERAPEFPRST